MKKLFALGLVFLLTLTAAVPAFGDSIIRPVSNPVLRDTAGHWAKDYIQFLYELKVVDGYPGNIYKPDSYITRAEAAKIIMKIVNPDMPSQVRDPGFNDIRGHWAYKYIALAKDKGIINGYGNGSFRPDQLITRAEIATILKNSFKDLTPGSTPVNFWDINGHWAKDAVTLAASNEIVNGVGNGSFQPDRNATRAEVATMIARLLDKMLNKTYNADDPYNYVGVGKKSVTDTGDKIKIVFILVNNSTSQGAYVFDADAVLINDNNQEVGRGGVKIPYLGPGQVLEVSVDVSIPAEGYKDIYFDIY